MDDYKVLYRKYRPNDFSNIIGQDYMVSILKNAIQNDRISHAYIFSGPRGTGKTSTAKVFAKAINCLEPTENGPCNHCDNCLHFKENADIIEIDAASNNGVDEIREIINNIKLAPAYSKYKVYIIDEVHMLSTSAFNALLLTLEEPPKHVVFILATTNIEAVPITILSRCQRFDFHKISLTDLISRLNYVVKEENIKIDQEAIEEIAYISDGGMRDALSILDQLSSNTNNITINDVASHFGSVSKKQIDDLYDLILKNKIDLFIEMMQNFKKLAIDYKLLIKKLLEKIEREAISSKTSNEYNGLSYRSLKEIAYDLANISNYVTLNVDPYLLIEITLLNYFPGNNFENKTKSFEKENASVMNEKKDIKFESPTLEKPIEDISSPTNNQTDVNKELIKIRVNNCFVNPQKEFLQQTKAQWPEFISNMNNKSLLSLLVDTEIVAASDQIIILTSDLEGTANLINNKLSILEEEYNQKYNEKMKFIALTKNQWQQEKNTYINNVKQKIKYKYLEERIEEKHETNQEENSFEKTAFDLFDKNKIEIE